MTEEINRARSRSRSRAKHYQSVNPYINFLSDFRKEDEVIGLANKDIFRRAGEKWRKMSPEDKDVYINAAKLVRALKENEPPKINKKKKKTEKKKRGEKKGGERSPKRSPKGKLPGMNQSVCSRCGHRQGSTTKTEVPSRESSQAAWKFEDRSFPQDANDSDMSSVEVTDVTHTSTSTASF